MRNIGKLLKFAPRFVARMPPKSDPREPESGSEGSEEPESGPEGLGPADGRLESQARFPWALITGLTRL